MKKVGILGGSGYTGGELIRLVLHHPALELDFVYSTTRPGTPIHYTHPDLLGSGAPDFTATINPNIDVVFLCVGHGKSVEFLEKNQFSKKQSLST
jgi:N-acetyl-gamma-glutamyl-phosphate reductase